MVRGRESFRIALAILIVLQYSNNNDVDAPSEEDGKLPEAFWPLQKHVLIRSVCIMSCVSSVRQYLN